MVAFYQFKLTGRRRDTSFCSFNGRNGTYDWNNFSTIQDAVKSHQALTVVICLPDTSSKKITVDSSTTVDEAILKLVKQIGLRNDAGYGLFEIVDEDADLPIRGDIYVGDLIRKFENDKRKLTTGNTLTEGRFLFRKRMNFSVKDSPVDLVELDLVYAEVISNVHLDDRHLQAVSYVVRGKFPINEELATNLASLQLQIRNVCCHEINFH
jgi:hypothetical protein